VSLVPNRIFNSRLVGLPEMCSGNVLTASSAVFATQRFTVRKDLVNKSAVVTPSRSCNARDCERVGAILCCVLH